MIIGVTGTLGAGRGVVVKYLLKKGFRRFSTRSFLNEEVLKRGLEVTRENMVLVANDLRENFGGGYIVEELYKKAEESGEDCVIDRIRCLDEVETLKKKDGFVLFAVDADVETRYARFIGKERVAEKISFNDFIVAEQREEMSSTSGEQNLKECVERANYVFKNDWTIQELYGKVDRALSKIRRSGKRGVYCDEGLRELIKRGVVYSRDEIKESQIQPSSLDLRLEDRGFCLPFSSVSSDNDFASFLEKNSSYDIDLNRNGFLHKGCVYVFKLQESLNLPECIGGRVNPKSSIGRIDVHVRLIAENGKSFDRIPFGYKGDLWIEIYPRSFDIIVHKGDCLNQMRLFDIGTDCLSNFELKELDKSHGLLFDSGGNRLGDSSFISEDIVFMRLELDENNPGFVAKHNAPPIDLSRRDHVFSEYFDRVYLSGSGKKQIIVGQNSFYILSSKEVINVPKDFCSEMTDIETDSGEVRVHYAGFFDPNWSAQATLEVRNFGQPFLLKDGQRVASFKFYPMKSSPGGLYGSSEKGSHYHKQKGPKLSKFFVMNE